MTVLENSSEPGGMGSFVNTLVCPPQSNWTALLVSVLCHSVLSIPLNRVTFRQPAVLQVPGSDLCPGTTWGY